MNKAELIKAIQLKADISLKDAAAAVDAYAAVIEETLKKGEKIAIAGFGTYDVKEKAERTGFNPATRQAITIPASKAPDFKFTKGFKDSFN